MNTGSISEQLGVVMATKMHKINMLDLKIDLEMHYMYRYVYPDYLDDSITHATLLCKRDRKILDFDSACVSPTSVAIVSSRRSNRFFFRI